MEPTQNPAAATQSILHDHFAGVLVTEAGIELCAYVVDSKEDRIVCSVPRTIALATEHVLHIPEDRDEALQLLLDPPEFLEERRDHVCDRWLAAHGTPSGVWIAFRINAAKLSRDVVDGAELRPLNPLGPVEPSLCRLLNAQSPEVLRALGKWSKPAAGRLVVVGVDPNGATMRSDATSTSRSLLVRLHWPEPLLPSPDPVQTMRDAIAEAGGQVPS